MGQRVRSAAVVVWHHDVFRVSPFSLAFLFAPRFWTYLAPTDPGPLRGFDFIIGDNSHADFATVQASVHGVYGEVLDL